PIELHAFPTRRSSDLYTLSYGGPIIKNRTFFFALWDGLLPASRTEVNSTVLTPCAARGIFRYFDNWSNGNGQQVESGGATPRIRSEEHTSELQSLRHL